MVFIRKFEGEWLVCTTRKGTTNMRNIPPEQVRKNYIIKHAENNKAILNLSQNPIHCPRELVGKRVRLKVEVIEDNSYVPLR